MSNLRPYNAQDVASQVCEVCFCPRYLDLYHSKNHELENVRVEMNKTTIESPFTETIYGCHSPCPPSRVPRNVSVVITFGHYEQRNIAVT